MCSLEDRNPVGMREVKAVAEGGAQIGLGNFGKRISSRYRCKQSLLHKSQYGSVRLRSEHCLTMERMPKQCIQSNCHIKYYTAQSHCHITNHSVSSRTPDKQYQKYIYLYIHNVSLPKNGLSSNIKNIFLKSFFFCLYKTIKCFICTNPTTEPVYNS